jgi:hypothetical protein
VTPELSSFLARYDRGGNLTFDGIHFRMGAPWCTSMDRTEIRFGLCEGFHRVGPDLDWGWVRFHMGEDRAEGQVVCPFDTESSDMHDDGGITYGTLICLPVAGADFEVRIAHMHELADLANGVLDRLTDRASFKAGEPLGTAGCYGIGIGRHTHTEIVSIGHVSKLLDELLRTKYGPEVGREYAVDEIVSEYRRHARFAQESADSIMHYWASECSDKRILYANKYRALFRSDPYGTGPVTRYSSRLLFGM